MAKRLLLLGTVLLASTGISALALARRPRAVPPPETAPAAAPSIVAEAPRARPPAAPAPPRPPPAPVDDTPPRTLAEQRRALFHTLETELDLSTAQLEAVRGIIEGSVFIGQGNPAITRHGMKRSECRAIREAAGLEGAPHPPCDRKNMVPVFDPDRGETAADARLCIDQFEFPDVPCEYPVVYASAREAALLCRAAGKRLCDAHEWEGACAGALHPPEEEYAFGEARPHATWRHNKDREVRWAYGPKKDHPTCAPLL